MAPPRMDTNRGKTDADGTCHICPHPNGPHVLLATGPRGPIGGGVRLCPEPQCQCYATWSVPGLGGPEPDEIPDEQWVEKMRRSIQGAP